MEGKKHKLRNSKETWQIQKQFWIKQKEKLLKKKETLEVKRKLEEKLAMLRWQAKYIDDNQKGEKKFNYR